MLESRTVSERTDGKRARDLEISGQRLHQYEVSREAGRGGMGEVYLAEDTRLRRRVAIKVLAPEHAASPQRRRRLEREALAASAINHPNACVVYGVGDTPDGRLYVAMEWVEGETLRARVSRGALAVAEALDLAIPVVSALVAAHAAGIVHRDIKPENVMVRPDGVVKVVDFGVARLFDAPTDSAEATLTRATQPGMFVGTPAYAAPEQVSGLPVDVRADLWAVGALLYELLSGRGPFAGATASEVMTAILTSEPVALGRLSPAAPAELQRIVRKCLQKDRERRYQGARDLLLDLESLREQIAFEARSDGTAASDATGRPTAGARSVAPPPTVQRWLWPGTCALLGLAAAVLALRPWWRPPAGTPRFVRFLVAPPADAAFEPFPDVAPSLALSPDGTQLVIVAGRRLWLRSIDDVRLVPIPGTDGARAPFWSPDGRRIGFVAGDRLKTTTPDGASTQTLAVVPAMSSAAWGADTILVGAVAARLLRVGLDGGPATPFFASARPGDGDYQLWPAFLPDGRHFLFVAKKEGGFAEVRVGSLDSSETTPLLSANTRNVYAAPGWLLDVEEGTLLARPFDASSRRITGPPLPVTADVRSFRPTGGADMAVSATGLLAYQQTYQPSRLLALTRSGLQQRVSAKPGASATARLSPDGKLVAVDRVDPRTGEADIWIHDLERGTALRATSAHGMEFAPIWSPDGHRLVFSHEGSPPTLHLRALDADGVGEPLLAPEARTLQVATDWVRTPRGECLLYEQQSEYEGTDVMLLPLAERRPRPWLRTRFNESGARASPDGRWVAYVSDESGRSEVYLKPFDDTSTRVAVTASGGTLPRWRADGRELYYLADRQWVAVAIRPQGDSVSIGAPQTLFPLAADVRTVEPFPDGGRFLVLEDGPPAAVVVVVDWPALLRSRAR